MVSGQSLYHGYKVLAALFMAGFMVYGGGLYCFVLFVPPLTEEFHWSRAATSGLVTSLVLGSTAGFAALGGLATGWVLDRYSVRAVGMVMHLLMFAGALSLLLVDRIHAPWALATYAACFGITIGGSDLYFVALLRRRFPAVSLAYSYSAWYFCEILTLLLAGPAAGRVFDLTGNYERTLMLLAASAVIALMLSISVWRPKRLERTVPHH